MKIGILTSFSLCFIWFWVQLVVAHITNLNQRARFWIYSYAVTIPLFILICVGFDSSFLGIVNGLAMHIILFFTYVACHYYVERPITLRILLELAFQKNNSNLELLKNEYRVDDMLTRRLEALERGNLIRRDGGRFYPYKMGMVLGAFIWMGRFILNLNSQYRVVTLNYVKRHPPIKDVDISFVVPCRNEEKNVVGTLETIVDVLNTMPLLSYEIVVIDDASTDTTGPCVEKFMSLHQEVFLSLYRNEIRRGVGWNYIAAVNVACGHRVMMVNGDNDLARDSLVRLVSFIGKKDLIVPFLENQCDRTFFRRTLSRLFTFIMNLISGNRMKYYNGPVIHLRCAILNWTPSVFGPAYQAELVCRALRSGLSYVEVPYRFNPNDGSTMLTAKNFWLVFGSVKSVLSRRLGLQND